MTFSTIQTAYLAVLVLTLFLCFYYLCPSFIKYRYPMGSYILIVAGIYFSILLLISYFASKNNRDNSAFFLGNRLSPWYIVAIGMLGDSISGVTFVSVPGMVGQMDMTYMQMVLGFFPGYLIVAFVLLPLYYRLHLTSIYGYLDRRFGRSSYTTGSLFFILSRVVGSAAKLYLVAFILQTLVFNNMGIPFTITVISIIALIWAYTFRSGMKTIVWTDALQTICLLAALALIIWQVITKLDINLSQTITLVTQSEHSRIFVFDDWTSRQHFVKQFLSGIFIVIVMTGLDQNMMQKNLSCRNIKDAQKNMVSYGFAFIPMNYLFLALGILMLAFTSQFAIDLPANSDNILPMLATEYLGWPVLICFTIGIIAASFSNADSAMTSITTSICVDLLHIEKLDAEQGRRLRTKVHILVAVVFIAAILLINYLGQSNILNTIYKAASYTYGPLLGMFFLGLFTKVAVKDKFVPLVCVIAPIACYGFELALLSAYDYSVGYEILLLNGLLTVIGLLLIRTPKKAS